MRFNLKKYISALLGISALALAGCGGGSGASSTTADDILIVDSFGRTVYSGSSSSGRSSDGFGGHDSGADGSAGDGLPIVGGTVVVTDASTPPKTVQTVTDSAGYFRVKITGFASPLVAKVTKPDGVVRYSLSVTPIVVNGFITVNITGLTSQIAADLAIAGGQAGAADLTPQIVSAQTASIATSIASIKTAINDVIVAAGLNPATFNPLTAPFIPNYTGYDFVLDNTVVPASPTTGSTQPSPTFVATGPSKSVNLAVALSEAQSYIASMNALYASAPTAGQISPLLKTSYLGNGLNQSAAATEISSYPAGSQFTMGGLGAYSGAPLVGATPAANVTYDANNCVTSLWVHLNFNGMVYENTRLDNTLSAPGVCSGGTWKFAGNQRQYRSRITTQLVKFGTVLRSGLYFDTQSSQAAGNPAAVAPYSHVEISGPGITNLGGTASFARLVPGLPALSTYNVIDDPYYGSTSNNPYYSGLEGSNQLQACNQLTNGAVGNGAWGVPATLLTPCLNMAQVVAGGDYTIKFFDATGALLETDMQRLDVTPANLPAFFYPTLTSITPAGSTMTAAGGNVTATWTLPAGALPVLMSLNINDANISTLKNVSKFVGANATSTTITVPGLPPAAGGSSNGLPASNTSFAFLVSTVGGIMVLTATSY